MLERQIDWFVLTGGEYRPLAVTAGGMLESCGQQPDRPAAEHRRRLSHAAAVTGTLTISEPRVHWQ